VCGGYRRARDEIVIDLVSSLHGREVVGVASVALDAADVRGRTVDRVENRTTGTARGGSESSKPA